MTSRCSSPGDVTLSLSPGDVTLPLSPGDVTLSLPLGDVTARLCAGRLVQPADPHVARGGGAGQVGRQSAGLHRQLGAGQAALVQHQRAPGGHGGVLQVRRLSGSPALPGREGPGHGRAREGARTSEGVLGRNEGG